MNPKLDKAITMSGTISEFELLEEHSDGSATYTYNISDEAILEKMYKQAIKRKDITLRDLDYQATHNSSFRDVVIAAYSLQVLKDGVAFLEEEIKEKTKKDKSKIPKSGSTPKKKAKRSKTSKNVRNNS